MRAPRTHLYPLDREKAGVKGGILVETLACVLNGYDRLNLRAGSNVLILGAGCVALLWTQLMRRSPTTRIFQTELVHSRREAAGKLGADVVVDPARDDLEAIVRGQSPGGVDCIIDGTGSADAIAHALPLLAKGGTLMIFGVCPANERLTVSPFEMFNNQWSIIASKMPPLRMTRSAKIIEAGIIDSETLVSRVLPLEDIKRGFGWFNDAKGEAIKMMIDPWL
ncbi:MAG: D-arabitol-phosphate dehydrogenase [candidate division BRC1 bacterium ADurb.BinA364]|nr:MAG: D-arabitol-phosphate dehydrogenase [candidate division BRC1 bacterium ADurb.BinA364]